MKINLIANVNGTMTGLCYTSETTITIGREVGNTIAALAADGLSRRHAKIFLKDGKWLVEDLGSMNGTYRLGEKVESATELQKRDLLQFGKLELLVDELEGDEAATKPVAQLQNEPTAPAASATTPAAPAAPVPPPAPAKALSPARPSLPGVRPGLKLPPRPVIGPGLKLPPKTPVAPTGK